jgi:hypothetical protein
MITLSKIPILHGFCAQIKGNQRLVAEKLGLEERLNSPTAPKRQSPDVINSMRTSQCSGISVIEKLTVTLGEEGPGWVRCRRNRKKAGVPSPIRTADQRIV